MKKVILLLLVLLPLLASAQPVKSSGIIYYDSIPNTKPSMPYGSEVAYSRAFAKWYRFNLVADDWEEMKGGSTSTTDSTSFVVYKESHGYNLASYPGEVIAVKADYTVAYADTVSNTQVGYVVGTPHPDSIDLQFSGLLHRPAHGLPPGKEYFLQDIPSGLSDTIPGTVQSRTFIVVDSNYIFLSEVGTAQDYDIQIVNIPAVYITGYGGDPAAPHDTVIQKIAELFAEVGLIRPGSYLVTNNTTISDNPTYQAPPGGPTTPSAAWVWPGNGKFVTRMKELVADVDLQDTLYGGLGTSILTPLVPAGSEPTTTEVATWYQTNYENNGLQLANGSKVYWVGSGTQSDPDLVWEVQDDLSHEGDTMWERIVKLIRNKYIISIDPGVAYVSSNGDDSTASVGSLYKKYASPAAAWEAIQAGSSNGTISAQNETYVYAGPWVDDDDNFIQPTTGKKVVFKTDGEIRLEGYPWVKGPISDLAENSTWTPKTSNGPVNIVFDMPHGVLNIDSDASARVGTSITDRDSRVNGHIGKYTCNDGESARWFGFYIGCNEFNLRIDTLDVQSGVGFNFWYQVTSSGVVDTIRDRRQSLDVDYILHNTTNGSDDGFIRYQPGTNIPDPQRADIGSEYKLHVGTFQDETVNSTISESYIVLFPNGSIDFKMEDCRFDFVTDKMINPDFRQAFVGYDMGGDTSVNCVFNFEFGEIINGVGEIFNSRSNSHPVDWQASDAEINIKVGKANFLTSGDVLFNDTRILGQTNINISLADYSVPGKAIDLSPALEFSDETVITISGKMVSSGASPVIDLGATNANTTIILDGVYLENDGTVPAISSTVERIVYVRGAFYTEDSGDDPDITFVFLDRNINHFVGFNEFTSDPSATLNPTAGKVYYFDTLSAGWTQEFGDTNLKVGDSFYIYFINTDTNLFTMDATTGGFIRPNANGDFLADSTEDINEVGFIEIVWDGANFRIFE